LIACQWAKSVGCRMIGTVSTNEKAELAKKYGCEFTINYKEEKVHEKVMEITNNKGVDVVYDGVGKDTFEKSAAQRKKGIAGVADKIKNVHLEEGEASLALMR